MSEFSHEQFNCLAIYCDAGSVLIVVFVVWLRMMIVFVWFSFSCQQGGVEASRGHCSVVVVLRGQQACRVVEVILSDLLG